MAQSVLSVNTERASRKMLFVLDKVQREISRRATANRPAQSRAVGIR